MRAALLLALCACAEPTRRDEIWGRCEFDSECLPDEVCARSDECLDPSRVAVARVTWTVGGEMPSEATCAPFPDLVLWFEYGFGDDEFGFEPVPCTLGLFTVDKWPVYYRTVRLGVRDGFELEARTDEDGRVTFDLMP